MEKNLAVLLFKGFFPSLFRYLSGGSRDVTKQISGPAFPTIAVETNALAVGDGEGKFAPKTTVDATIQTDPADEIRGLEEARKELETNLADQTKRVEEVQNDLVLCERHRVLNLQTALHLYRETRNLPLIQIRDLVNQIDQLRNEVHGRDLEILSRDQLIQALYLELGRWMSQEHWLRMQQRYIDLQQAYGEMPRALRHLEQKYQDLEDAHVEVVNKLKEVEAECTGLKVEQEKTQEERSLFEEDARKSKQSLEEVQRRLWASEVQRDHMLEQRAESDGKGKAKAHEHNLGAFATDGVDKSNHSDAFNARRQRGVAEADENILGPLGLGFTDGSPTLKTSALPESSNAPKKSKFMDLFPKSTNTPDKPQGGFTSIPAAASKNEAKEAFHIPQSLVFNFGESNNDSPSARNTSGTTKSSTPSGPSSKHVSTDASQVFETPVSQAPSYNPGPAQLDQAFSFDQCSDESSSAAALETTQSGLSAAAPEHDINRSSSAVTQRKEPIPEDTTSTSNHAIKQEKENNHTFPLIPSQHPPNPTPKKKKSKGKKNKDNDKEKKKDETQPITIIKNDGGPNRKQRRAAVQERKAAEKRVKLAAEKKEKEKERRARRDGGRKRGRL